MSRGGRLIPLIEDTVHVLLEGDLRNMCGGKKDHSNLSGGPIKRIRQRIKPKNP